MTNNNNKPNNCEDNIENKIFDNLKADEQDQSGLLPPQALLSTPPPSLDSNEDSSALLSPWWSEERPVEQEGQENVYSNDNITSDYKFIPTIETNESIQEESELKAITSERKETTITTEAATAPATEDKNVLNISLLSFGRSSPKDSQIQWKERCLLLATTTNEIEEDSKDVQKELENVMDKSKECSMVCFLKTSQQLTEKRSFNPFYGTFISVAKTPQRCKEHLLNPGDINKKSFTDYYTMELGEELSHTGEYVTKAVSRTFSPLQHLTQKYIDSWKDGSQQYFFSKFWSSIRKGDAFYLVRDSTKKLLENALNDKKPSDKK